MSLNVGKSIAVATNFVKSNPAIPVYKGEEKIENLHAVIYHIEIGFNKNQKQEVFQYVIVDYKSFKLDENEKEEMLKIAKNYCSEKGILEDENLEIKFLDDEMAENFIEKVFSNMKLIRGLISND
ncbi:hypothetical protein [Peptostreptococcus equinus]|uniref:Uncharacterized protein n=1 Tax=Peptostreptococcus equinus TaxID=3003601 RepID=A0ABY7JS58_9FIRM|nr:hypothetical protein [Peptostreptococcus sp. CBA3647]WAW15314.1 hypothetical protein O0R46_02345 [Peptostreptococcus sp. CBA3647]